MEERLASEGSIKNYRPRLIASGLVFIGLNIMDAWLTMEHLAIGNYEGNPLMTSYGSVVWFKALLAGVIVFLLIRFGKAKLLWVLNICMLAVVLWNAGWLLYFL
ncbi:hypothetical protein ES703_94479 [subsurface metagenome]